MPIHDGCALRPKMTIYANCSLDDGVHLFHEIHTLIEAKLADYGGGDIVFEPKLDSKIEPSLAYSTGQMEGSGGVLKSA